VAFFYIAAMALFKQLFQLLVILFFLVGCVSDNNKTSSSKTNNEVVKKERVNQTTKKEDQKKIKGEKKNTSNKNSNAKASKPKNKKNKKPQGKKAILNNTNQTVEKRMEALLKLDKSITKPDEYKLFKKIVQNPKEHLRLREAAIKKIYKKSGEDLDMLQYMFSVIRGKDDSFKPAVLYALKTMSYSSQLLQQKRSGYLQAMRDGLLTTQSKEAYRQILKDLAEKNDPEAAKTLINILKTNDYSKFALKDVFPILSRNIRPQLYPSMHSVLQNTKSEEIKIGMLPLIAEYPPARTTLLQLLDNTNEDIKVRLKAAEVFADKAKPQFYQYTKSIIFNENDNIKLRRFCLQQIEKFDFKIIAKYKNLQKDLENFATSDIKLAKSVSKILGRF